MNYSYKKKQSINFKNMLSKKPGTKEYIIHETH